MKKIEEVIKMQIAKIWELKMAAMLSGCLSFITGFVLFVNNPIELPVISRIMVIVIIMTIVFIATFYCAMINRFIFHNPKKYVEV